MIDLHEKKNVEKNVLNDSIRFVGYDWFSLDLLATHIGLQFYSKSRSTSQDALRFNMQLHLNRNSK